MQRTIGNVFVYENDWSVLKWFIARASGNRKTVENEERELFKRIGRKIVEEDLKKLGFSNIEFEWNRKAGCRCGCSPGYRIYAEHNYQVSRFHPWKNSIVYWLEFENGCVKVTRRCYGDWQKYFENEKEFTVKI